VSDPSNVRLLRVAFDVLPDVDHLDHFVLSLLKSPCLDKKAREELKFVAWYTISELLKAGATETGFVRDPDEISRSVNVDAYRARLAEVAEACQRNAKVVPWYLRQQSALFLLIHGKQMKLGAECGSHYRVTMNRLRGKWLPVAETLRADLPAALRAVDLGADPASLRDRISEAALQLPLTSRRAVLRIFDDYTRPPERLRKSREQLTNGRSIALDALLAHPENPFRQENAALQLAEQLLMSIKKDSDVLDAKCIAVSCKDYSLLCNPDGTARLKVTERPPDVPWRPLLVPGWCRPENRWRLGLAMILTQALRQRAQASAAREGKRELRYSPVRTRATHAEGRRVDLIVLPELAVHPEDLHLIRLLISKTRAWIFCGIVFEALKHSGQTVNRGAWLIPTFEQDGTHYTRRLLRFDQGKHHLTPDEIKAGIVPCRLCQWVMVGRGANSKNTWRLSAAICYDATDLRLAADLRDVTDGFIVAALNQDVPTFDNMIAALHYHMFQHVVLVNSGEFGGSSVQAPYTKHYVRNRVHAHGSDQVAISICEMKLLDFRRGAVVPGDPDRKTPPAGFARGT
jgi:hypothetical protein